jgi:hypothetical protein
LVATKQLIVDQFKFVVTTWTMCGYFNLHIHFLT